MSKVCSLLKFLANITLSSETYHCIARVTEMDVKVTGVGGGTCLEHSFTLEGVDTDW